MKFINTFLLITILVLGSCQEFDEMNLNPNEPTDVPTDVLLPSAIRQSMNTMVTESFLLGNNAAQLTSKTLRTEVDSYNWNAFPTVWEGLYGSLTDIVIVEQKAVDQGNALLEGAAITLKSWIFATLTNAYGDIPYGEAIAGRENNFTPAYDSQEAIYNDLLSELERAAGLLAGGEGSISGDILLGGDSDKWLKFTNSLRLRLLMYVSNKTDISAEFASIVNSGDYISSNEDNVVLDYLSGFPNQFPTITLKTGDFDAVAFSQTALDVMSANSDPRLSRFARPDNNDYDNPEFSGAVNGQGGVCNKTGSRLGAIYFNDGNQVTANQLGLEMANGIVITYAETEFLIAEAAAKGWVNEDIEEHYRNGIEASMDYYNVNYEPFGFNNFENYYNTSGVAYDAVTDIWEQKWISLYFTGLEPYFEVRRWYHESNMDWSGIPFLSPSCENLNGDQLPLKFLYPGEEQSLNSQNYNNAIQRYGGSNDINSAMWLVE